MEILKRKAIGRNDPSPEIISNVKSPNQMYRRQSSRRPFIWKVSLIGIFLFVILNLYYSLSSTSPFLSLDIELIVERAEDQGGKAIANVATKAEEKATDGTSLASYSYGTTDVNEFKRLHHEYLLSRQQQLNNTSHLSTQAREKDANGKNMTSYGFIRKSGFIAGFRNQMMALTMLAIRANHGEHKQLILDHLTFKDTYGTEKYEPFEFFFDVEHWNKYSYNEERLQDNGLPVADILEPERYPNWLPRLVFYDPSIHDELNPSNKLFSSKEIAANPTRPYAYQEAPTTLFGNYIRYGKGRGPFAPKAVAESQETGPIRNPAEILLLKGALQPHPALQAVVDRSKEYLRKKGQRQGMSGSSTFRYMTLHARVEPDMQKHPVCRDKKVLKLQEIVDMIESKWPEPPVGAVFLPINRQYLEKEGTLPPNFKNDTESNEEINWIAVENLQVLNRVTNHNGDEDGKSVGGLWNGRVPVVEFGSEALRGTVYEHRPSLSGAILDYFLALDADIFIGTEVSSFSSDILGSRFYRGLSDSDTDAHAQPIDGYRKNLREQNYKYLPGGLEKWISDEMTVPPGFVC